MNSVHEPDNTQKKRTKVIMGYKGHGIITLGYETSVCEWDLRQLPPTNLAAAAALEPSEPASGFCKPQVLGRAVATTTGANPWHLTHRRR